MLFSCRKETKYLQTNQMNIFSSSDIVNLYYMTSKRNHCFERNKDSPSFRTNDETISVRLFAFFCIFLLSTYSYFYLSIEICFPEIWLVFYVSIFYVTLKLFSLFHFNEIYFSEWSRYLFNNTCIVGSSLMILYPC